MTIIIGCFTFLFMVNSTTIYDKTEMEDLSKHHWNKTTQTYTAAYNFNQLPFNRHITYYETINIPQPNRIL